MFQFMPNPELLFGLVGAIGTDLESVQNQLITSLRQVNYEVVVIRLSDLLRDAAEMIPECTFPERTDSDYYDRAMTAGNIYRKKLEMPSAMAALAIASITQRRKTILGSSEAPTRRAYILHSLKRSEEIRLLRSVYGASLFVVSAYAPRQFRVDRLASQLAEKGGLNNSSQYRVDAEKLVYRDEDESGPFGQNVRKAYPLGDLFVDTSDIVGTKEAVSRFIELIFGNPWRTPSKEEQGMAFAYLASVRSGSPARQVGAALMDSAGNLISVGTNEVSKPRGGQYWEGDDPDGRDFRYENVDVSDKMRRNLLADVLRRLRTLGMFGDSDTDIVNALDPSSATFKALRDAQLFDTIDFVRAVHAEAASILASVGRSKDATLLVTTFPCHECARHIVAAGIKRVLYVEPYPKSLVSELYRDSIAVDQHGNCGDRVEFKPFTGVSPTVYQHLFQLTKDARKDEHGKLNMWNASIADACLHIYYSEQAVEAAESDALAKFAATMKDRGVPYEPVPGAA